MKTEEKNTKLRYGTVNFERRRYPRVNVDLPVEYVRSDSVVKQGRAMDASEGGLLIYFPEKMKMGQHLKLKLFFTSGVDLKSIEALVEVVWMDIDLGKDWGEYRAGVRFVDISQESMGKLKNFMKDLFFP
jgi:c-di-GMP-binding flagellar brake protein YcgR